MNIRFLFCFVFPEKLQERDSKAETASRTEKLHYVANPTLALFKHLQGQHANAKLVKNPE